MATVKAVKAVTEVTISLTGDEALTLMALLMDNVSWDGTPVGELAEDLHGALEVAGIDG